VARIRARRLQRRGEELELAVVCSGGGLVRLVGTSLRSRITSRTWPPLTGEKCDERDIQSVTRAHDARPGHA
jgi:hypothetical protein